MRIIHWLLVGMAFVAMSGMALEAHAGRLPESLTVSNKQLLVAGKPFVVRGVNYQPVPRTGPGNWPDDWTMDTGVVLSDFAKMKEMGVNTIRVYVKYDRLFQNWNEQNDPSLDMPRVDPAVLSRYRTVMTEADKQGIYVIMNYWLPEGVDYRPGQQVKFNKDARTRHKLQFRNIINVFKNRNDFPMVLMWAFGNENNFDGKRGPLTPAELFTFYQEAVSEAKSQADASHPYTVVLGDNPQLDIHNTSLLNRAPAVDVWSLNIYNTEQGFKNIIQNYPLNKPLLFTEFGYDACDNSVGCDHGTWDGQGFAQAQRNQANFYKNRWENTMLPNLSATSSRALLGGVVFEWNDEWWKSAGDWSVHDDGGFANGNLGPDYFMNEEWFGLSTALEGGVTSGRYYRSAFQELKRMWTSTTPPPPTGTVQVVNPSFDQDGWTQQPSGWSTWSPNGSEDADFAETYGGRQENNLHGTHYKTVPYHVFTYQPLSGLANGTYTLRAWVYSSGGQTRAEMHAKDFDGTGTILRLPVAKTSAWTQVSIPNIQVTAGQLTIGFLSDAPAYSAFYFDDVEVFRQ
ncbi:cellulase family glycosylhydrolase [Archangium violaceum]|uniref:cellulase family glycosylhydrolase n=1 Tax=Archangium violaceum TaxID=83451 RepID=UPI001EEF8791|nr:cellulase family glycosylhydrolase [Archangium violaceum]